MSCDCDTTRVRIDVADTGPGIDPDKLDRLFVAFDRLDAERGSVQGTGLGLALCKSLVELMGGTIVARSSPENGSVFTVELMVASTPALPAWEPSKAVDACTILYIEDNPSNGNLVERAFASDPEVRVILAIQGSTGLELARAHQPDLILLDLDLPDIHGSVVLDCLRADPDTAEVPVIVVSADATEGQIRFLIEAGAQAYLTKPLDIPDFLDVVSKHLPERAAS